MVYMLAHVNNFLKEMVAGVRGEEARVPEILHKAALSFEQHTTNDEHLSLLLLKMDYE